MRSTLHVTGIYIWGLISTMLYESCRIYEMSAKGYSMHQANLHVHGQKHVLALQGPDISCTKSRYSKAMKPTWGPNGEHLEPLICPSAVKP